MINAVLGGNNTAVPISHHNVKFHVFIPCLLKPVQSIMCSYKLTYELSFSVGTLFSHMYLTIDIAT